MSEGYDSDDLENQVVSGQLPSNNRITCVLYVHTCVDLFHNMRQVFTLHLPSGFQWRNSKLLFEPCQVKKKKKKKKLIYTC